MSFAFENSFARLPDRFFADVTPAAVGNPSLIRVNRGLAAELGLDADALAAPAMVSMLAGNAIPDGARPLAMAYAGHQFGNWVPQLGDGRAILLGEVVDRHGRRRDIQLKGAGRTPFSRMGDGRAPLGPVLREYIVSEAMAAMGVPTTRALAAVATGEPVLRETVLPGAVLTRVAASHIRVGTFQFFAAREDTEGVALLADHVIDRHYPDLAGADDRHGRLLDAVIARQARLVAAWMALGFIHGVMNTDNMTVSGETIDYGPCAFMDGYHPATVYSSIDHAGRYAFVNQPRVAHWNLAQFAQSLLPLLGADEDRAIAEAQAAVDRFPALWQGAWLAGMRAKLGLSDLGGAADDAADEALMVDLLERMAGNRADFTLVFRRMGTLAEARGGDGPGPRDSFADPAAFDDWAGRYAERAAAERASPAARRAAMDAANPLYIPRNHLVEAALTAAHAGDFGPFHALVDALADPYTERAELARYAEPPRPDQMVHATFCGT